jgi:hypothetical protein
LCEYRQPVRFVAEWNGAESQDCNEQEGWKEILSRWQALVKKGVFGFESTKEEMDPKCR